MPDVDMMEVEEKGEVENGVEGVVVDALPYIDHGQYCLMDHLIDFNMKNWLKSFCDAHFSKAMRSLA